MREDILGLIDVAAWRLLQPNAWGDGLGGCERPTVDSDLFDPDPGIVGRDQNGHAVSMCNGARGSMRGFV